MIEINGLPHCPRNRSHTILRRGNASFLGKTEAARMYEEAILMELGPYSAEVQEFAKKFDINKHCLEAIWELHSPDVLTKTGKISENGTDLDAHKVLQDTVMGFIGIDDAYIVKDTRTKLHGDYKVCLSLKIKEYRKC